MPPDNHLQEMSMSIIKASRNKADGRMNFRMVASDTDKDLYATRMSLELFGDFVRRIEHKEEVPEPFRDVVVEDTWDGGMPYLSVAHYKSAGGKNVPGSFEKIYVDGDRLKALGFCFDSRIGNAVFQSLCDDLVGRSKYDHKIRASIGFLDLKHAHGNFVFERKSLTDVCPICQAGKGEKIFLAGQLVHIALTREPVNPRTDVRVEERSMDVTSKQEDAESILGKAVDGLDLTVNQSTVSVKTTGGLSDVLQVRSGEMVEEEATVPALPEPEEIPLEEQVTPIAPVIQPTVPTLSIPAGAMPGNIVAVDESTPVDLAVRELIQRVSEMRSLPDKEAALLSLQPVFNNVAEAIQQEFSTPPDPTSECSRLVQELSTRFANLEGLVTSMQADMAAMKMGNGPQMTMSDTANQRPSTAPVRRSLVAPTISLSKYTTDQISKDRAANLDQTQIAQPAIPGVAPKMQELARQSVYGK